MASKSSSPNPNQRDRAMLPSGDRAELRQRKGAEALAHMALLHGQAAPTTEFPPVDDQREVDAALAFGEAWTGLPPWSGA